MRRIPPPRPLWQVLCRYWGLSTPQARRCWQAVYTARWSTAVAWRQSLVYFEGQVPRLRSAQHVMDFLKVSVMPTTVVQVLEALVQEGRLTRAECTPVQEQVLRHVGKEGDWRVPDDARRKDGQ